MQYWLFKSEPGCFSLDDLECSPGGVTPWDGVRNYHARNIMRSMRKGDMGFFYHSGKNAHVAGLVEVVREAYPDHTAQDPSGRHFDPRATPGNPVWYMVDVRLVRRFARPLYLEDLRREPELVGMELLRRGSRLSVQPVERGAFERILAMAGEPLPA